MNYFKYLPEGPHYVSAFDFLYKVSIPDENASLNYQLPANHVHFRDIYRVMFIISYHVLSRIDQSVFYPLAACALFRRYLDINKHQLLKKYIWLPANKTNSGMFLAILITSNQCTALARVHPPIFSCSSSLRPPWITHNSQLFA